MHGRVIHRESAKDSDRPERDGPIHQGPQGPLLAHRRGGLRTCRYLGMAAVDATLRTTHPPRGGGIRTTQPAIVTRRLRSATGQELRCHPASSSGRPFARYLQLAHRKHMDFYKMSGTLSKSPTQVNARPLLIPSRAQSPKPCSPGVVSCSRGFSSCLA
jgi:hypothetical protein